MADMEEAGSQQMIDDRDSDVLRFAITSFLRGEYPHPRKYRPNPCPHGTPYSEECVRCDAEHFKRALADADRIRSGEKAKDAEPPDAMMFNWIREQQSNGKSTEAPGEPWLRGAKRTRTT